MFTYVANSLWLLACLPEAHAFRQAQRDVAGTQHRLLLRLLHQNADTVIGRRYRFAHIRSIADYQARVPLSTYADYQEAIEHIGRGKPGVLTRDPVLLLEPTSGSTAATKYIPYTAALRAEFERAIAVWIADLFTHDPRLMAGAAYWSVSPVAYDNRYTVGGIPIGFEDDRAYLGRMQQWLAQAILAVPSTVRLIHDMDTLRYVTLLALLRRRDLALISVWNPTFLTLLVRNLSAWGLRLAIDIAEGTLTPPTPLAPQVKASCARSHYPDAQRAGEVYAALCNSNNPALLHTQLWPHLRLISCWADAQAALCVPPLAQSFPQAQIQGKGLIATEGFVSIPLVGQSGAALAVRSHFFEFLPTDGGTARLAHELETGGRYAVVLTTAGGLYRYQLYDLVEVSGWQYTCPLLRFVGRSNGCVDWFGEKLHEQHVRAALAGLLTQYTITPDFVMLTCAEYGDQHAYTLLIEADSVPDHMLCQLARDLDAALATNYHYRYCRDLGQLAALRVRRVVDGHERYLAATIARGQRAGDIKPPLLRQGAGWCQLLGAQPPISHNA